MTTVPDQRLIELAERMADAAGAIARRHFRTGVAVETKPDLSPVTLADRAAEAEIRRLVAAELPAHGVVGEEYGWDRAEAEYVWVIDPIDGTKAYLAGIPVFGTLIALTRRGVPMLGVIDQPVTGERWLGAKGRPTTLNGAPARTRRCPDLARAILCATTPHMFIGPDAAPFARVRDAVGILHYGTECYGYGLLASGCLDLVVEADMAPYDYLAHVPIVEGAGGAISDWQGRALRLAGGATRLVAAGDRAVHAQALALLGEGGRPETGPAP
jgi:histidinol phosphatase-like enzyme (inositol monophosphatase family)